MTLQDIAKLYGRSPQANALVDLLKKKSVHSLFSRDWCALQPPCFRFDEGEVEAVGAFVLDDADEAGYFYHDLTQMLGQESVFFFPSSYRRAVKYGQRDAANEILRTEVLARLSAGNPISSFLIPMPLPNSWCLSSIWMRKF